MDDLKSDALHDMDVEIRLDATRRKPRFIIETAEMTLELTRLIQQLTARAAVPIIGYQQDKAFPLQQDSLVRVWAANGHVYAATETDEFLLRRVIAFDLSQTGTICVSLQGGQISYVSRRYVRTIRQALGL